MAREIDVVDALATALFALGGVVYVLIGFGLLPTIILSWLGIILILLGLGSWCVAKGILDRMGEVGWLAVPLALVSIASPFLPLRA